MTTPSTAPRDRLRWSDPLTLAVWALVLAVNTVFNGLVARDDHPGVAAWEPWVWEITSSLTILLLVPVVLWFYARVPLRAGYWRWLVPLHLLASVVFSLVHVAGMVGLRELAYRQMGAHYDFGPWWPGWRYEYLKDIRTYVDILVVTWAIRHLLLRSGGEARVLAVPDAGVPAVAEAVPARPERFLVRKLDREFLIATDDIERIEANGNYVNLIVAGHAYPLRSTMAAIEAQLDPRAFVRVHRSHIVRADQIASIEPLDGGDARLHLRVGGWVPCSRRYREGLRG